MTRLRLVKLVPVTQRQFIIRDLLEVKSQVEEKTTRIVSELTRYFKSFNVPAAQRMCIIREY